MKSDSVRRTPRIVLAVLAAALAALAAVMAPGASPAWAATTAQDITVSLSPTSGSDYTTDTGTLSWTLSGACVGQYVGDFIYQGTAPWDLTTIKQALGAATASQYFGYFLFSGPLTTTTGSTSWPNVAAPGYMSTENPATYATTGDLVAAQGTGTYTIGLVCTNSTGTAPLIDSSGNPIAGSIILTIGATGNSWAVDVGAVPTQTALTGTSQAIGQVTLTATETTPDGSAPDGSAPDGSAPDGSAPDGSVNFYLGNSATGTPLNGSTPVPVGGDGQAQWTGAVPGQSGGTNFTAQFTPASGSPDTPSADTQNVAVIVNDVTIAFTATQDPATPSSVDITATATLTKGQATTIQQAFAGGPASVNLVEDGGVLGDDTNTDCASVNTSNVATYTMTDVTGSHTFSVVPSIGCEIDPVLDPTPTDQIVNFAYQSGTAVTVTPASAVTVGTGPYASKVSLTGKGTGTGYVLTASATAVTSSGTPTTVAPVGTITFKNGSTVLATDQVTAPAGSHTETATLTLTSLTAAPYHFTATFTPTSSTDFTTGTGTLDVTSPVPVTWLVPGKVTVTGTAKVGDTLTAHPGTWIPAGASFGYQWQANGTPIPGATGPALTLGAAQYGQYIGVTVTGYKTSDITVQANSPLTTPVAKGTLKTATPVITGTAKAGDTIKATPGTWTAGTKLSYQWLANGTPIKGATATTLKLTTAQAGKKIQIQVTGTQTGYTTATTTSAPTNPVAR
jgi:hypothetical protein